MVSAILKHNNHTVYASTGSIPKRGSCCAAEMARGRIGINKPMCWSSWHAGIPALFVEYLLRFLTSLDRDVEIVVKPHLTGTTRRHCRSREAHWASIKKMAGETDNETSEPR